VKKPDLTQVIQILANVGVIAGIVFLAVELRQNNETLRAQVRLERAQTRTDGLTELANNPELVRARVKDASGAELTPEERHVIEAGWETLLTRWQYVHGEWQAGLVDLEDIPVEAWKRTMDAYPSFYRTWQNDKAIAFRPDFAAWMDRNVVEPRPEPPAQSAEDAVRAAVRAFYTAFDEGFVKDVTFATDDWHHINPFGGVDKGRDATLETVREVHTTFLKDVTDTPEPIEVRFATDDVAVAEVVSTMSPFTGPDGVRREAQKQIRTFVVVKRGERWLIMQDHNTNIAEL
jgi:uncharacterized protein (TIGR02246 family)